MALRFKTLPAVTISLAGTPVPISASSVISPSVIITADPLNTGKIYVGGNAVNAADGIPCSPGQSVSIKLEDLRMDLQLADIFVDTATNGNVARINYLSRN